MDKFVFEKKIHKISETHLTPTLSDAGIKSGERQKRRNEF